MHNKYRKKANRSKGRFAYVLCCIAIACVTALAVFIALSVLKPENKNTPTESDGSFVSEPKPEPPEIKESFVNVLNFGDIMMHDPQLQNARVSDEAYDFSPYFKEAAAYFKKYDLSVANLEVTLGSRESGNYRGYPMFNSPDCLIDEIKSSGLNFLLTANNHSYDTSLFGLKRTASVLKQKGMDFIGTRENSEDMLFTVKEVGGIKIGMANYTYETDGKYPDRKYLNGILLSEEANELISSFSYRKLDKFYSEAETVINSMKQNGAEFIVFYMHWGNEYKLYANTLQKTIAQKLAELGVDIIVGGHPHVIEPVELIHSQNGISVCIYSTGNAISNQRQELMESCPTGHTEDGLFFTYKLRKYGEDVTLEEVNIIPTWVNKYRASNGKFHYTIYPLEYADMGNAYGFDAATLKKSKDSYERTKAIVAPGLTEVQQELGCEVTFK